MSHAAHRYGTVEELQDDYNILVKPNKDLDDINEETKEETIRKTKEMADIAYEKGAVNLGRKVGCTGRVFIDIQGKQGSKTNSEKKPSFFFLIAVSKAGSNEKQGYGRID